MEAVVEQAPAKLNLALHVRRRRADGYHDLETLFAFAEHGDMVTVRQADRDGLTITGPFAAALSGDSLDDNLVIRAARAFRDAFKVADRHAITLDKHLPVASGIGGGSADAAATLRALAKLHGIKPTAKALIRVAAMLGADVPACLLGRTAAGTGRGDKLVLVEPLGCHSALLVNPGVAVSTRAVFAGWDGIDRGPMKRNQTHELVLDTARAGRNDLQAPALLLAPVIGEVLARLEAMTGATLVRMSGSGATCFALFDTPAGRAAAAAALRAERRGWWLLETALA